MTQLTHKAAQPAAHANLGQWLMWIIVTLVAFGVFFASITASQSHG
jgi:hypothetical protein